MPAVAFLRAGAVGAGLGLTVTLTLTIALALGAQNAAAGGPKSTARAAMQLFADHCFSPFLTAERAAKAFALSGAAYDFYDLDPFSSADPTPATARAVTPGTDRRCEISFAGNYAENAAQAAVNALFAERITEPAPVPASHIKGATTTLLAARRLNQSRVAVVHVGTRQGAQGIRTFMLVERLTSTDTAGN